MLAGSRLTVPKLDGKDTLPNMFSVVPEASEKVPELVPVIDAPKYTVPACTLRLPLTVTGDENDTLLLSLIVKVLRTLDDDGISEPLVRELFPEYVTFKDDPNVGVPLKEPPERTIVAPFPIVRVLDEILKVPWVNVNVPLTVEAELSETPLELLIVKL